MIHYVVTREHSYTIRMYLETWGRPLLKRFRIIPYDRLVNMRTFKLGVYIFSDIERLSPVTAEAVRSVREQLAGNEGSFALLNDPARTMRRYDLLRTLHEQGINSFNAYRVTDNPQPQRYPVFIRGENDHSGARTGLIASYDELQSAIDDCCSKGMAREEMLITEFCDTSEDGLYRKYGVFIVGDKLIPRHVWTGRGPFVKVPGRNDDDTVNSELEFLRDESHLDVIRHVMSLAHIDYGRVDFGLADDKPQIWEINTNPCVASQLATMTSGRHDVTAEFTGNMAEAFEAIDDEIDDGDPVRIIPPAITVETERRTGLRGCVDRTLDAMPEQLGIPLRYRMRACLNAIGGQLSKDN